jgi:hypothetical protein
MSEDRKPRRCRKPFQPPRALVPFYCTRAEGHADGCGWGEPYEAKTATDLLQKPPAVPVPEGLSEADIAALVEDDMRAYPEGEPTRAVPVPEGARLDDQQWALARVQRMASNARINAGRFGLKLLKGHGYPDEVMSEAQDAIALDTVLDALTAARAEAREALAATLIRLGLATGHGDTHGDILRELEWQVAEQRAEADALRNRIDVLEPPVQNYNRTLARAEAAEASVARLTEALRAEQQAHEQTVAERDNAQEWADKLAYAVASEDVIGEHTNMNEPWANALKLLADAALRGEPEPGQ